MIYLLCCAIRYIILAKSIQIMCQRHKYVKTGVLMQRLVGSVQYLDTGV